MGKGLTRSLANARAGEEPAIKRYRYPVRNVSVTVASTGAAIGFGTAVIGDFPEGNILYVGGVSYLSFATADADIDATWEGNYGIGTTAIAGAAIANTEENLITEVDIAAASGAAKASNHNRGVSTGAAAGSPVAMFNNTDGSLEVNLNVLVDAADIADDSTAVVTVNGYVDLFYAVSGDD